MSNVLKAAQLDFSLVKPYIKTICFILIMPVIFGAIKQSLVSGISFAMCFSAMTSGYTFSVSEKNAMDRLYGILPVSKKSLVYGRYIFVIGLGLCSLLVSLIVQLIVLRSLGTEVVAFDIILSVIVGFVQYIIFTAFQLPGYYKYGSIKGRFVMFIPAAGILLTLLLVEKLNIDNIPILTEISSSSVLTGITIIAAIMVVYTISIFSSVRIFGNKEL